MKTYPYHDPDGVLHALEIEIGAIPLGRLAELLRSVDGVDAVEMRRPFTQSHNDVLGRWRYKGLSFTIVEPFGGNSRYWLGPEEEREPRLDITPIHDKLAEYTRSLGDRVLGFWAG